MNDSNNHSIYDLLRSWFDFCFENPDKIKPNHTAVYVFAIEHCNRLGWKSKFGLPSTMVMEAVGIKSYNTYIKTLNEIVAFGFLKMVEKSKNQYSSNIIALSKNNKALDKALDKALIKHATKHCCITQQSIDSINRQVYNNTIIQINNNTKVFCDFLNKNSDLIFSEVETSDENKTKSQDLEAYDFLKKESPEKVESFEMQNKKSIPDFDVFVQNFNSKVILEEIPYESKKLYARLLQLNTNWDKSKSEQILEPSYSGNR